MDSLSVEITHGDLLLGKKGLTINLFLTGKNTRESVATLCRLLFTVTTRLYKLYLQCKQVIRLSVKVNVRIYSTHLLVGLSRASVYSMMTICTNCNEVYDVTRFPVRAKQFNRDINAGDVNVAHGRSVPRSCKVRFMVRFRVTVEVIIFLPSPRMRFIMKVASSLPAGTPFALQSSLSCSSI